MNPAGNTLIVKTVNLTKTLAGENPVTLVDSVNLELYLGEMVAITGPSGSGKSSLLYLLGLLDKPSSGKIWLRGKDISLYAEDALADIRLAELGFVFQFHFLLPEFTLLENVMLPMQRLGKLSATQIQQRAKHLLAHFGLEKQIHKLPHQISGGQSQRVAIARALANDPVLILADEPTGNLDTASSQVVENILKELAHEHHCTVLIVTHETRLAAASDRVITLVDGKIT
jgi:lipoprotein-releasing system ATP-binding protein